MEKEWILPAAADGDLVETILAARGIPAGEAAAEFLSERPQLTHDPFLMKGLREAAERILAAAAAGRSLVVYGDYDSDGMCAVALLTRILGCVSERVSWYIPSRFDEGYGLNNEALAAIRERGGDLVVTVDCGSVSYDEAQFAAEIGLELIVTDHHNLNDRPVDCLLVNPKQAGCAYPEKGLSGTGVAFKLAQGLARLLEEQAANKDAAASADEAAGGPIRRIEKADLNEVLDLVAIATIGDIVPLTGENRTLVKYGLRTLNGGGRLGLARLAERINVPMGQIRSDHVAFGIVPHLNAAGRMRDAETGVALLTGTNPATVSEAVDLLAEANQERRRVQEATFELLGGAAEALDRERLFLLLDGGDAHEGITGIVAGKLKDRFHKPTAIVTDCGGGLVKGTGRSIEGVDLYRLLSEARHLFQKFGGHAGACGFSLERANLPELEAILERAARRLYEEDPGRFRPKVCPDAALTRAAATMELARALEAMEPFGHQNPKPLLYMGGVVPARPYFLGEHGRHARFRANGVDAILFQQADACRDLLTAGRPIDLAGHLEVNRWNGTEKIQFVVADLRWYNE